MPDLSLTVIETWDFTARYLQEQLEQHGFSDTVELQLARWNNLFSRLKSAVFQNQGMEISEIGSTWLSSLVGMKALRPFATDEVLSIGGVDAFIRPLWDSAFVVGDRRVWSIPWLGEARVIFYWRDMLESAGIDPATAFQTPPQLEKTLQRLQAHGFDKPWGAPTVHHLNTLHHCAVWIWQAGGRLLSRDGRQVEFAQPSAIRGMESYFRLHPYIQDGLDYSTDGVLSKPFMERKVAVMMSGPWDWIGRFNSGLDADMIDNIAVALPPGPAFAGSSNLVISSHIPIQHERTAVELIKLLLTPEVQVEYCKRVALLPVRVEAISQPPYSTDPGLQVFVQAMMTGRYIPNTPLWGVFEERLAEAFGLIWRDIKSQPHTDFKTILNDHLQPLAHRLNRMLTQLG